MIMQAQAVAVSELAPLTLPRESVVEHIEPITQCVPVWRKPVHRRFSWEGIMYGCLAVAAVWVIAASAYQSIFR
jgi:hypothetical protein